jgi:hypothetical protein
VFYWIGLIVEPIFILVYCVFNRCIHRSSSILPEYSTSFCRIQLAKMKLLDGNFSGRSHPFVMSPPLESFPASEISKHVPSVLNTSLCPLKQLAQFQCILDHNGTPICFPIIRRFRVYCLFVFGLMVVVPWMVGKYWLNCR